MGLTAHCLPRDVSGLGLTTHYLPPPPKACEPENLNPKLNQIMDAYRVESSLLRMLLRQLPTPGQGGGYLNRCAHHLAHIQG